MSSTSERTTKNAPASTSSASAPASATAAASSITIVAEATLPKDLTTEQAVEAAYASELAEIVSKLRRNLPVLVECDKEIVPFLFVNLRGRLKQAGFQTTYLDGRPRPGDEANANCGFVGTLLGQLRDAVRGAIERRVVVLPHIDLLTTGQGGLTAEAREVVPLLYENPDLVWLGFKDPSFTIPTVIQNLFPHRVSLLGIARDRLRHLITQKECRKFGSEFNPWVLYKYVSGVNAVRLRRLLSTLEGEDYPADPRRAYNEVRQATLTGSLEIPNIDLDRDIGGYAKVKTRLRSEIIDVLAHKENVTDGNEVRRVEELIPKGMIFWGPPGTGKTLFAKAMASALGAAVTIVSGPELKSKWVGDSEENLRQIFRKARQSAPAIIVFDELDSFAAARGTYTGSGVEHSMVNQLLTEMDGFHRDELVFVVGTTNFVEILDPALLRPGRFEFHLHIPYPEAEDRREILKIYNSKMNLRMSDEALEEAVRRTAHHVPGTSGHTRFSGDHLNALCRAMARVRLRENRAGPSTPADVEQALMAWIERPKLTAIEERVLATHEAGHAVVSLHCPHAPPIERITIASDVEWAFGYVRHTDPAQRYVQTRNFYLDAICVAMGGREGERLLLDDLSLGATGDLQQATAIARDLVEIHGLGGDGICPGWYREERGSDRLAQLSSAQRDALDGGVRDILESQRARAARILTENRAMLEALRDLLLQKKTIDAKGVKEIAPFAKTLTNEGDSWRK